MRQDEIIKKVSIGVVEKKKKGQGLGPEALTVKRLSGINGAVPKGISGNLSVVEEVWLDKLVLSSTCFV